MYPQAAFDQAPEMESASTPDVGIDPHAAPQISESAPTHPDTFEAYEPEEYANLQDELGNDREPAIAEQSYEPEEYANLQDEFGNDREPAIAEQSYEPEEYANLQDELGNDREPAIAEQSYEPEEYANLQDEFGNDRAAAVAPPAAAQWVRGEIRDQGRPSQDRVPPMQREPQVAPKFDSRAMQRANAAVAAPGPMASAKNAPSAAKPNDINNVRTNNVRSNDGQSATKPERSTFKAQVVAKSKDGGLILKSAAGRPGDTEELIALPASAAAQLTADKRSRHAIDKSLAKGAAASPVEISNFNGKWSARDTSQDALRRPKALA